MLCEQNDDVTNNALFIACIAVCKKINTPWAGHSIDAACTQRGELACIPKAKVGICRQLQLSERAYRRPTFCMTATSQNASAVFSLGTALHRRR